MKDYLTTVKEKVIVVKEGKGKIIAITTAVCAIIAIVAVVAAKVCKTCDKIYDLEEENDDVEVREDVRL